MCVCLYVKCGVREQPGWQLSRGFGAGNHCFLDCLCAARASSFVLSTEREGRAAGSEREHYESMY